MTWKIKLFLLVIIAVPAFTGYPVNRFDALIIPGVSVGWLAYLLAASLLIWLILGSAHFGNALAVSTLIALPVVFVGGGVSYLFFLLNVGAGKEPAAYSPHYISLLLTMLTVIPLSLSLVAVVPFHEIEQNLLTDERGVSGTEKKLLMFLRVFNHIVYSVIPGIMEVMREEGRFSINGNAADPHGHPGDAPPRGRIRRYPGIVAVLRTLTRIGIEGICAAVQYIPLWAVEIARLPDRKR